jgi:hypothetical protein
LKNKLGCIIGLFCLISGGASSQAMPIDTVQNNSGYFIFEIGETDERINNYSFGVINTWFSANSKALKILSQVYMSGEKDLYENYLGKEVPKDIYLVQKPSLLSKHGLDSLRNNVASQQNINQNIQKKNIELINSIVDSVCMNKRFFIVIEGQLDFMIYEKSLQNTNLKYVCSNIVFPIKEFIFENYMFCYFPVSE